MIDLLGHKVSKKQLLREWFCYMKHAKSSEVMKWGVEHFCNDPDRLARKLAKEGYITRVSKERRAKLYPWHPEMKEEVWEVVEGASCDI